MTDQELNKFVLENADIIKAAYEYWPERRIDVLTASFGKELAIEIITFIEKLNKDLD